MATKKTSKKAYGGKTAKKGGTKKPKATKKKPAAGKSKRKSSTGIVRKVKTVVGKVLAGAASGAVRGALEGAVAAGSNATGIGKEDEVASNGKTKSSNSEDNQGVGR